MATAGSAARGSQKKQATQALIAKLDTIIQQQFATYASRNLAASGAIPAGFPSKSAYRSWYIRRNLISGDLPDSWAEVKYMAENAAIFTTSSQRSYIALWNSLSPKPDPAIDLYQSAECLFMIVMQGGIANCLDCGDLRTADRGDEDNDGRPEFHDAWQNPIGFILWPAAVQLPPSSSTDFFSGIRSLDAAFPAAGTSPRPTLGMRPMIFSAGPDGKLGPNPVEQPTREGQCGYKRDFNVVTLEAGTPPGKDCGNPAADPCSTFGSPTMVDAVADNITNLDAEAAK